MKVTVRQYNAAMNASLRFPSKVPVGFTKYCNSMMSALLVAKLDSFHEEEALAEFIIATSKIEDVLCNQISRRRRY